MVTGIFKQPYRIAYTWRTRRACADFSDLSTDGLKTRGVHGNGIPLFHRMPTGIPREWEHKIILSAQVNILS